MPTKMYHNWYMHGIKKKIIIQSVEQFTMLLNMNRTMATKANNHYESLGIPSNATFSEIKTAYYKLTLQYHPDKNKSELAKKRFHEISNAYDILSRYETRKQYDKTLITKHKNLNFIKQKTTLRTDVSYKHPKKIYNFDEWVQMHYSIAFMDAMEEKRLKEHLQKEKDKYEDTMLNVAATGIIFMMCLLLACIKVIIDSKIIERKNRKP